MLQKLSKARQFTVSDHGQDLSAAIRERSANDLVHLDSISDVIHNVGNNCFVVSMGFVVPYTQDVECLAGGIPHDFHDGIVVLKFAFFHPRSRIEHVSVD